MLLVKNTPLVLKAGRRGIGIGVFSGRPAVFQKTDSSIEKYLMRHSFTSMKVIYDASAYFVDHHRFFYSARLKCISGSTFSAFPIFRKNDNDILLSFSRF
jgi:hypothetical protein